MAGLEALTNAIYHEKQQPGEMLCAQHALNAVLQGSYFTAPDLSSIAQQLDQEELEHNPERGQTSENMDDTGFFSVQVVARALEPFGLTLVPWRSEELRQEHSRPGNQRAFILNHQLHWFTLRRFGTADKGHWYDLNSMIPAPEYLSGTYLGMFIQQAEDEGYSVFAVRPSDPSSPFELPRAEADALAAALPEPSATARAAARLRLQSGPVSGTSTPRSMASGRHSPSSVAATAGPDAAPSDTDWMVDEDIELQAALQASLMASGGMDPGEGSWTPPTAPPAPLQEAIPPTRNRFAAPGAFPVDDNEELDEDDGAIDEVATAEREARELEAAGDDVGAGMARSRAALARFQREQAAAARGLDRYRGAETPEQREARERRNREREEEEEMMRRAIEESMAMAEASKSTPRDEDVAMGDIHTPNAPAPAHRTLDDEDEELQAALRASLESVPAGFEVPASISAGGPGTVPRERLERSESIASVKSVDTYATESDTGTEDGKEAPQESVEEMRKKRLARFGQ